MTLGCALVGLGLGVVKWLGLSRPLQDDLHCRRPDEDLSAEQNNCAQKTSKNRRIEFHIIEENPEENNEKAEVKSELSH